MSHLVIFSGKKSELESLVDLQKKLKKGSPILSFNLSKNIRPFLARFAGESTQMINETNNYNHIIVMASSAGYFKKEIPEEEKIPITLYATPEESSLQNYFHGEGFPKTEVRLSKRIVTPPFNLFPAEIYLGKSQVQEALKTYLESR